MNEPTQTPSRRTRGRLLVGALLLIVGCFILASNLGILIPNWWNYWPWLLIVLGLAQFVWPGSFRERMIAYWMLVVGGVALISTNEWLGLHWGNSWPLFIIAAGVRVILGSLQRYFRD